MVIPKNVLDYGKKSGNLEAYSQDGFFVKNRKDFPPVKGCTTPAYDFERMIIHLIDNGGLAAEGATFGSSGVEKEKIRDIMQDRDPDLLQTCSGRAVKNFKMKFPEETQKFIEEIVQECNIDEKVAIAKEKAIAKGKGEEFKEEKKRNELIQHKLSTKILYKIIQNPDRIKQWKYREEDLQRIFRSVRPSDQRLYRDTRSDFFMSNIIPFNRLPPPPKNVSFGLKEILIDKDKENYSRSATMPFAMAHLEEGSETRKGYEKIVGLYEQGYACFYRRCTVEFFQEYAKKLADVTKKEDITPEILKKAEKQSRKLIRQLYHLSVSYQQENNISMKQLRIEKPWETML